MEYGIHELAELAGVTTRTLRWYDKIGLLKPIGTGENGYRRYGGAEVDRLQQILLYRALGVELAQIRSILDDPGFDRLAALKNHLSALQEEQQRLERLIASVEATITSAERNEPMKDAKKFEAFKKNAVEENEKRYGTEIRQKYGDEQVNEANAAVMNLTVEQYADWKETGETLQTKLEAAVETKADPAGPAGEEAAALHKRWLTFTGVRYSPQLHRGLAMMYTEDERFTAYYDKRVPGCAAFLRDAVLHWIQA